MAATRRNEAGNSTVPAARFTRITPSSKGWRSDSRAATGNSPSSSKKSTPWVAKLASPGRRDPLPPPTREMIVAWWWGARNGGRSNNTPSGSNAPADRVNPRQHHRFILGERWQKSRQTLRQHRLAGAGWPDQQQVMATRSGNFEGTAAYSLTTDVRDVQAWRSEPRRRRCRGSSAMTPAASGRRPAAPVWRRRGRPSLGPAMPRGRHTSGVRVRRPYKRRPGRSSPARDAASRSDRVLHKIREIRCSSEGGHPPP